MSNSILLIERVSVKFDKFDRLFDGLEKSRNVGIVFLWFCSGCLIDFS